MSEPGAIVVGGYANGVGAVRALATRGVPVDVVLTMPEDIAQHSRYVRRHYRLGELAERPESLIELLEQHKADWRGWAILPTNDHALKVLAQHHERLAPDFRLIQPPWEVTRQLVDKDLTYAAAGKVGVDTARSYGPAECENIRNLDVTYPVLVKPLEGHLFSARFGTKLFLARNSRELSRAVERVESARIRCGLYDYIPGPDNLLFDCQLYMTRSGQPTGVFFKRKLRLSPPRFGVGRAAETVEASELTEPSVELLRYMGWRGIASVSYKLDPRDGRFRLIEVNGRCPLGHGLARRAGINLPLLAFSENVSGEAAGDEPNGWEGVWIHLHADLLYSAWCGRREGLNRSEFWRSYRGPKTYAVWSPRDPKPFLTQWAQTLRKASRMLTGGDERKEVAGRVQWPAELGMMARAGNPAR